MSETLAEWPMAAERVGILLGVAPNEKDAWKSGCGIGLGRVAMEGLNVTGGFELRLEPGESAVLFLNKNASGSTLQEDIELIRCLAAEIGDLTVRAFVKEGCICDSGYTWTRVV